MGEQYVVVSKRGWVENAEEDTYIVGATELRRAVSSDLEIVKVYKLGREIPKEKIREI